MDKIWQLLERGFWGGIVMAAAFVGFAVFLYLVYRLIKFLQSKTVQQEEQYKVSGRGRVAYLILCLEEVLRFYGQNLSAWERILRELWSITNNSEGDWIGTWLDSVGVLLPVQFLIAQKDFSLGKPFEGLCLSYLSKNVSNSERMQI